VTSFKLKAKTFLIFLFEMFLTRAITLQLTQRAKKHYHTSFIMASRPKRLVDEDKQKALSEVPSWTAKSDPRDEIFKQFKFNNFNEAWGFMNQVALEAEKVGVNFKNYHLIFYLPKRRLKQNTNIFQALDLYI
jgi:hypothetical protein